jgi:hypothetical protein
MYSNKEVYVAAGLAVIALLAWRWILRTGLAEPHSSPSGDDTSRFGPLTSYATSVILISAAATIAASAVRWVMTSPAERGFPFYSLQFDLLLPVCAGVTCLIVLLALEGQAGLVPGIAAAVAATSLTATTVWSYHFTQWTDIFSALQTLVAGSLGMIVLIVLTIAPPVAFLPSREPAHRPTVRRAVIATAAVLSAALGVAVLSTGDLLLINV